MQYCREAEIAGMRQLVRSGKLQQTVSADENQRTFQQNYSRPISGAAGFGFLFLGISLTALTFIVTAWGVDIPRKVPAQETHVAVPAVTALQRHDLQADTEVIYEPKTTGRLPVFGGLSNANN